MYNEDIFSCICFWNNNSEIPTLFGVWISENLYIIGWGEVLCVNYGSKGDFRVRMIQLSWNGEKKLFVKDGRTKARDINLFEFPKIWFTLQIMVKKRIFHYGVPHKGTHYTKFASTLTVVAV